MMRNTQTHDPILTLSSNAHVNKSTTQYNQGSSNKTKSSRSHNFLSRKFLSKVSYFEKILKRRISARFYVKTLETPNFNKHLESNQYIRRKVFKLNELIKSSQSQSHKVWLFNINLSNYSSTIKGIRPLKKLVMVQMRFSQKSTKTTTCQIFQNDNIPKTLIFESTYITVKGIKPTSI